MRRKGLAPILIVVLIAVAALGGGFFIYQPSGSGCRPTGCSGQVCSDEDVITTCEYRAEYACYKNAKCERQADGKCGWSETDELKKCLEEAKF